MSDGEVFDNMLFMWSMFSRMLWTIPYNWGSALGKSQWAHLSSTMTFAAVTKYLFASSSARCSGSFRSWCCESTNEASDWHQNVSTTCLVAIQLAALQDYANPKINGMFQRPAICIALAEPHPLFSVTQGTQVSSAERHAGEAHQYESPTLQLARSWIWPCSSWCYIAPYGSEGKWPRYGSTYECVHKFLTSAQVTSSAMSMLR